MTVTTMTQSTTAGNSDRAFLAHAVSTLGAALRSLERIELIDTVRAESNLRFHLQELNLILYNIREDERNARSNPNATGGVDLHEADQP